MRHLATVLVVVLLSGPAAASSAPPSCVGHWTGWGQNVGDPWSIDMRVTAASGETCGTIEYPSLGCGGALTACATAKDGTLTLTEVYDHNPGTCAPAGTIVARCTAGTMAWTWTGQAVVHSTLTRE